MNSDHESSDLTHDEWLERESHGDEQLKELLIRREAAINKVNESSDNDPDSTERIDYRIIVRDINARKEELGINPLNEG